MKVNKNKQLKSEAKKIKKISKIKDLPTKNTSVAPTVTKKGTFRQGHTRDQHVNNSPPEALTDIRKLNTEKYFKENDQDTGGNLSNEALYNFNDVDMKNVSPEHRQEFMNLFNEKVLNNKDVILSEAVPELLQNILENPNSYKGIDSLRNFDQNNPDRVKNLLHAITTFNSENDPQTANFIKFLSNTANSVLDNPHKTGGNIVHAIGLLQKTASFIPDVKEWNSSVDKKLDKITDNGKNNSLLNDAITNFTKNGSGDIKQEREMKIGINSLIEHAVSKPGGADRLDRDLDDNFNFYLEKTLESVVNRNLIGHSRNPKNMHRLIRSRRQENMREKIDPTPTNIINDQYSGSDVAYGQLMRRSVNSIIGNKQKGDISKNDAYLGVTDQLNPSIYKSTNIDKSKTPDQFNKSINEIYDLTQSFLKENPDFLKQSDYPDTLLRGYNISQRKNNLLNLDNGLFSTSIRETKARNFTDFFDHSLYSNSNINSIGSLEKAFSEKGKILNIHQNKKNYLHDKLFANDENVSSFLDGSDNLSLMLHFDSKKLQDDGRIFAIFTGDGLAAMKDKQPNIKFRGGEGEVVINT